MTAKQRAENIWWATHDGAVNFFLAPASARPLGVLRALLAATLLLQAFFLSSEIFELFGQNGIMQESLTNYIASPNVPRIQWITRALSSWGVTERQAILGVSLGYLASLVFLFAGLHSRAAAFVAWLTHWTLMNSGFCTNYGADIFSHIFLFYLIWMPAGRAFSLDVALDRVSDTPTDSARLALRVLQIHLCVVYLASGVEKAVGPQWWNGEAMWRSLMLPVYNQFDFTWLASYPGLAKMLGWGTLVVELGYPVAIWWARTRPLWVAMIIGLHLGIAFFLGLTIFGLVMAACTLAAFGFSAEPYAAGSRATSEVFRSLRQGFAGKTRANEARDRQIA